MSQEGVRKPQIEAVPLVFSHLEVDYLSARDVAATYGLPMDPVENAFKAASERGYVEPEQDLYRLTQRGKSAISTRGDDDAPPLSSVYLALIALSD